MSAREQALPAALESAAWELAKMAYRAGYRDGEDALSGGWNALLKEWRDAPAAAWTAIRRELLAEAEAEAEAEVERLRAWLKKIDGGDNPCTDESQLRQWAYEAITLGREVTDG